MTCLHGLYRSYLRTGVAVEAFGFRCEFGSYVKTENRIQFSYDRRTLYTPLGGAFLFFRATLHL